MDHETEAVVVGAGVVGLSIARGLARQGIEVVLLEAADSIGSGISSRNSEVIHAGIYYPPGSNKARMCVHGKALLYEYMDSHAVPYARCGKLIVAADSGEEDRLLQIDQRARRCGVDDLRLLSTAEVAALEPAVEARSGVFSPSTGIVDSHQLMLSLHGEMEDAGGVLALASPVEGGLLSGSGQHVVRVGGAEPTELGCRCLINASGLYARDTWLKFTRGNHADLVPPQYYARGHYYSYSGKAPFSHLVYPLPAAGGLGIHATLDLAGQVRFGPDVQWIDSVDYAFDTARKAQFVEAIRHYYPGIDADRLQPAYTGIRPKTVGPHERAADFQILGEAQHGIPGFISLHGIESPGLTASLAIAEYVLHCPPISREYL